MAILKMDKIKILGLKSEKSSILSFLQKEGAIELIDLNMSDAEPQKEEDEHLPEMLLSTETTALQEAVQAMQKNKGNMTAALKILEDKFSNVLINKKEFKMTLNDFLAVKKRETDILHSADEVLQLANRLSVLDANFIAVNKEQNILKNWLKIEVNPADNTTRRTKFFIGTMSENDLLNAKKIFAAQEKPIAILPLDEKDDLTYLAVLGFKEDELEIDHLLKQNNFHPYPLSKSGMPRQIYERNQAEINQINEDMTEIEEKLKNIAEERLNFYILIDYYNAMIEKQEAAHCTQNTSATFFTEGYTPEALSPSVKAALEKQFTVFVEIEKLEEKAQYPILLKNKPFANAYQNILEMFGAPNTGEIDPTPGLAPFAFIFFGMMLSDVGYGFLLTAFCAYLLWKVKIDTDSEGGSLVRMLFLSGISSTLWGFVFGGFFGDLLTVFSDGKLAFPKLWFNPMDEPQKLLVWSMIFGVIHLFAGMAMKIINEVRFGKISNIIFDVVPWYFLLTGLGIWLAGDSLGVTTVNLGEIGKWMAIAAAAVVLLFSGRDKKNPIARLFSGIGGLYGVVNYLGDILSYTRVLALVLATSVIASVVNFLAKMVAVNIIGTLFAIVILIAGHALNLALSGLSAYVHSNRLQYVEFFGQFFEGGGSFFKPLMYRTKHIKIDKNR